MLGGYSQQAYQQPQLPTWAPPGAPQMQQQPGYGYMQQPGTYPSQPPQYGAYPSSYPDQSSNLQPQQTATATAGYDYYGQQQPVGGSATPTDNNSYSYGQQQGYGQENYSGGNQSQQSYAYPSQDGSGPTYGTNTQAAPPQAAPSQQAPPHVQASATHVQGYNGQQQSSTTGSYPSQPGYGSQVPPASYGQPPTNKVGYLYGQPLQAQSGYGQAPPSSVYGPQLGYSQQPSYGAAYSQPQAYSADNAGQGAYDAPPSASPAVPTGVAKASPQS